MNNRDDFSQATVNTLGRRAGYLCSNPTCRKHTSGPNSSDNKSTTIGVAAHITAAAPGGPRYDVSLSSDERRHINNGIWLCGNCASLIDKDVPKHSTELLKFWKAQLELEMSNALSGNSQISAARKEIPVIEAELIKGNSMSHPDNYSSRYQIQWRLKLIIRNNSSFPAYHLKLVFSDNSKIKINNSSLTKSNLVPFGEWELDATTQFFYEGDGLMADDYKRYKIPRHLNGLSFKISYKDEARNEYLTLVTIDNDDLHNELSR